MTKPINEYQSLWQWSKDRSSYHFDKQRQESPGQYFRVAGHIEPNWQQELDIVKQRSIPRTWDNITYSGQQNQRPISTEKRRFDIAQGGGDLDTIELTNTFDDFSTLPCLQSVIDHFGLESPQSRCHVQLTGQMFTMHIDPLERLFTGQEISDPDAKYSYIHRIVRVTVMLEDWEPGQFKLFGNQIYQQWRAGDFYIHDWANVPHATANASEHARITLQITGLATDRTKQILGDWSFQ